MDQTPTEGITFQVDQSGRTTIIYDGFQNISQEEPRALDSSSKIEKSEEINFPDWFRTKGTTDGLTFHASEDGKSTTYQYKSPPTSSSSATVRWSEADTNMGSSGRQQTYADRIGVGTICTINEQFLPRPDRKPFIDPMKPYPGDRER